MTGVKIVAALRSAVAPRGGALARLDLHELASPVLRSLIGAVGLSPDDVDEVVLGNALGGGGNPARMVALAAGLAERVAGLSIDRQCCGGLDALVISSTMITSGLADVVVAGGVESYSRRPLRLRTDPDGGEPVAYDRPPFAPWPALDPPMDAAADALAAELGITREMQDLWAVESHRKARAADLAAEIVPIGGVDRDSFTRDLPLRLAARAPSLAGTITAANSAVAADGVGLCLLVSDRVSARIKCKGLTYRGGITLGGRPERPGAAPVVAMKRVLSNAGLSPDELTVAEIMEAFAAQAIACTRGVGIDPAIVNPGGGALARGHPIGASGAINAVRLFHELQRRGGTGIAAIAAAGGLGTAVLMSLS
ncbi:thiolase family protein [Paracoccus sp. MBLB3053]|uniref:Thiolase family protein n=1 Tax=Paracoccus aurantius TaxID=3073814 RepID=A0ABU2HYF0_9RHOB|nr:thiolase family protein [Paracoccus sp. MBLB3053]MDS9470073.1 thiolase family protein [Paracoccus sp. MBLB3053]